MKGTPEKISLFDPTQPNTQTPHQKQIGRYKVMSHCLGTGSFATVHLAFDPMNHKQVACKSIRTRRQHEIKQVMKEVRILMTLKHVSREFAPCSPQYFLARTTEDTISRTSTKFTTLRSRTMDSCLRFSLRSLLLDDANILFVFH